MAPKLLTALTATGGGTAAQATGGARGPLAASDWVVDGVDAATLAEARDAVDDGLLVREADGSSYRLAG